MLRDHPKVYWLWNAQNGIPTAQKHPRSDNALQTKCQDGITEQCGQCERGSRGGEEAKEKRRGTERRRGAYRAFLGQWLWICARSHSPTSVYWRRIRGATLVNAHMDHEAQKKDTDEESAAIWDHAWDVSLGGWLMDEKQRQKMLRDAKALGGGCRSVQIWAQFRQ